MMKKYIAKTNVSINVVLRSGQSVHISFTPQTNGGSVFYTDNADIQEGLSRHYKFGKLFRLDQKYSEKKPVKKPVDATMEAKPTEAPVEAVAEEADAPVEETTAEEETFVEESDANGEEEADDEENALKPIAISDIDSAKDYLSEKFGISRTKMKSKKAIMEAASANGIVFTGL